MFSTGSPLSPEGFDWVYREIKQDILLASISGGTDIISCFVLGNPVLPVYRGEIQCRGLGMAVDVFDDEGKPVRSEKGELVCTKPFPVMPVGFWNDPDGARYRAAYFERFPTSGAMATSRADRARRHDHLRPLGCDPQPGRRAYRHGGNLPPGRAAAGNPRIAGHRPGLAAGQERRCARRALRQAAEGHALDAALIDRVKKQIRDNTTPRHVPAKVVQVQDIPRTKSGKIVELAVRNVVHAQPVKNVEALANPEALAFFRERPELAD
jgi:acetoacetyl-CoA synthetase